MDWKTVASDEMVCTCRDVDKGTIVTAVLGGVDTVQGIVSATGAGSGCQFCREKIAEIINSYSGNVEPEEPSACCGSGCCF